MNHAIRIMLSAAVAICLVASTSAADKANEKEVYDPQSGFEMLKTLAGRWVPTSDGDESSSARSPVTFRVTANDSAVIATFYGGSPNEMISVFHLDGDSDLVHTHYCALGNQPTMRFAPSTVPGELKFLFSSGTNMDAEVDMHVHNTTIRLLDNGEIESETEAYAEGKKASTLKSRLARSEE